MQTCEKRPFKLKLLGFCLSNRVSNYSLGVRQPTSLVQLHLRPKAAGYRRHVISDVFSKHLYSVIKGSVTSVDKMLMCVIM